MTRYDDTIICLMGPTASGKTRLALSLAETLPVAIVSVDSVMVYRGMDIGSAKPDAATLSRFPHKLIDIRDPSEPYSAAEFCRDAVAAIHEIIAQGKIPLLVGGTMLYFRALQTGLSELPSADASVREKILAAAENNGWPALHAELATIDPQAAARIHPHDSQRIQRALEVFRVSGTSLSAKQKSKKLLLENFQIISFAVAPTERAILHERIAQRFQLMLEQGLVEEVRRLYKRGDLSEHMPAIRSAGYRQVWEYLSGKLSYEEMQQRGIISTRQLAKRQLTWLRHWSEPLEWFDSESINLKNQVMVWLEKSGIKF